MKSRAELKALAKQQIKGNIGGLFLIALVIAAISVVCSFVPVIGSLASFIVTPALTFSTFRVYYKLSNNKNNNGPVYRPSVGDAFFDLKIS